jgi:uncharacterized membrane protein
MGAAKLIVTAAALLGAGTIFGASLYDTFVIAPNLRGGPAGMEHFRLFMSAATPANLFRFLSPATQVLLLAAIILNWSSPGQRWPLVGALLAIVATDVITFTYHYPRNRLMFDAPMTVDPERLATAARQWASMNFVRVALIFASWLATLSALMRLAALRGAAMLD